ncbi:MAG: NnrU family protein [Pseudomonadota bacterium]
MPELIIALSLFVGTHFLMSHPLRARLVGALGTKGFQIVYSLVSLGTFAGAIKHYLRTPDSAPLWAVGDGLWVVATLLMLFGSILFVGSIVGNPALPAPGASVLTKATPKGALAITRHPMMWGFACWALCHLLVSPQPKMIALSIAFGFLAIAGSAGQDHKKALLMGADWKDWESRTSFIPFAGQLAGRIAWAAVMPKRTVLLAGVALWLVATRFHPAFGAPVAGIWRWFG